MRFIRLCVEFTNKEKRKISIGHLKPIVYSARFGSKVPFADTGII